MPAELYIGIFNCVLTAFILIVGYWQLKSFNKTNNAQFLHNLAEKLFTEETITLITLLHSDCITFNTNNNYPFFKINSRRVKDLYPKRNWTERTYYTTYEMDFLLLNHLDRVGSLVENKIAKLEWAYQDFAWYVGVVFDNRAIQHYFTWLEQCEQSGFVFSKLKHLNSSFHKLR